MEEVAPQKDFAFDVGANDGYDTYGLAWLMSKGNQRPVDIISFEPGAGNMPSLLQPREWQEYSNCTITVVQKFVGAEDSDDYVTLDNFHKSHPELHGKSGLIKIDIEGFETEALNGAQDILQNDKHDWLIEIHGKDRVAEVAAHFTRVKRAFLIKDLSALPFIGNEHREIDTYWLMTI
ncbi:MAG: FkbM family methyltransferase [Puniceicoccaceae bacterium]